MNFVTLPGGSYSHKVWVPSDAIDILRSRLLVIEDETTDNSRRFTFKPQIAIETVAQELVNALPAKQKTGMASLFQKKFGIRVNLSVPKVGFARGLKRGPPLDLCESSSSSVCVSSSQTVSENNVVVDID